MSKPPVYVFADGFPSGQLFRSDREDGLFVFGYEREASEHEAVSLTMPVRPEQYESRHGLLPIFEMNLPEGTLKGRLHQQFAKSIPQFDDLDLLSIVGASQIGRLRHSLSSTLDETVPAEDLREILTYRGSEDLFSYLLDRFARFSGISGMQPKVLVRDTSLRKLAHHGATHIVKSFDAKEFPELAANEFICTQAAAAAGIHTVRAELSENRQLLIVDRFDLLPSGKYVGIEDFCVLNALSASERYDGSYEEIAKRLGQFASPEILGEAREQYALMVAFACAIENGDAHLKNFSVLYDDPEGVVRLAPAYDMVTTTPYIPKDTLALTLEGSKAFPNRKRLLRFVRKVTGKTEAAANSLLDQVAVGTSHAIELAHQYAREHDVKDFGERLSRAFERGLSRLSESPVVSVPDHLDGGPAP